MIVWSNDFRCIEIDGLNMHRMCSGGDTEFRKNLSQKEKFDIDGLKTRVVTRLCHEEI